MKLLPTVWAGTLSMGLSVAVLILLALYFTLQVGRGLHIGLGVIAALLSLVVISSGVDSIIVHGERSVLVYAAIAIGAGSLIAIVAKAIFK